MRLLRTAIGTLFIGASTCAFTAANAADPHAANPEQTKLSATGAENENFIVRPTPNDRSPTSTVVRRKNGRSVFFSPTTQEPPPIAYLPPEEPERLRPTVVSESRQIVADRRLATSEPQPPVPPVRERTQRMKVTASAFETPMDFDDGPQVSFRRKSTGRETSDDVGFDTFESGDDWPASTPQQSSVHDENPFSSNPQGHDPEETPFDLDATDEQLEESFAVESQSAPDENSSVEDFDFSEPDLDFETAQQPATAENATNTARSAVPHTPVDSLPSQHTGAQTPRVEVRWIGRETLSIGQESQCSLVVTNNGSSMVRNVVVEAAIPPGVDVIRARPAPQKDTSRWAVGDLAAGEERTIEMLMLPQERGDIALNAFVRFTGYSTSVFSVKEPMLQMVVEGPTSVTIGEQAKYVVTVHNPGTGVTRSVVVEARVPEGLQYRSGSVPRIDIGALKPGESRQAALNLTAISGGEYLLVVRSMADGGLQDEARADVVIAEPRLQVDISGPESETVGKPSEYQLSVTNSGNTPSINVRAKYKIPAGFEFVNSDRGGVLEEAEHLVDWFVGTLQPGETTSYRVILVASEAGQAQHQAGVVSERTKATRASHLVDVQGLPKIELDVAAARQTPAIGEETVIHVRISNAGGIAAEKVGLFCELPSGLEFVAAAGPSEHLAENGVVIFRSLEQVEAGQNATYRIKARCVRAGEHRVRARVASGSLADPVNGERVVSVRHKN